ncbi:ABC transporter permease [Paracoccus sediminicola]|uniref:ABC transporter permease n=1 Tax=Paracoccus sediminicola TaxID=3017783 RepID=UPI0022F08A1C|nr:ABC transporter permease [Paracoccus sediminicola]WBU56742.1 ABC transporter permease [Paracoccus sediminicola]
MFEQRQTRNMFQAALTTIALIYHMTVYKLRKTNRNAVAGLMMTVLRAMIMVAVFFLIFYVIGIRESPIRGNFIVYIMTGIFMFMTHNMAIQAVLSAEGPVSALMKHAPMNTAIGITASALAALYQQVLACAVLLLLTNKFIEPLNIESLYPCIGLFLLAWFSGCCIGMLFRALMPWWPQAVAMLSQFYRRLNMISSGKMVVANTLPPMMLNMFDWNPLFHVIDQTRGFAFVNYTPHNSSISYPIYVSLALAMIGLMGEFFTRNQVSLSWSAGR